MLAVAGLLLAACSSGPSARPAGPLGAIQQQAATLTGPNVALPDGAFEDLLVRLDLKKAFGDRAEEIAGQLRASRESAVAQRARKAAASGPRHASVAAGASGLFIVPLFAQTLGDALDAFTAKSGTQESKPNPYSNTTSGPTTSTATTVNITETLSSSGSKVTLTMHWLYKQTTRDTASGATLVDITDERTMVGTIDVCPDAAGNANATLDVQSNGTGIVNGVATTTTSTSGNQFTGRVDDQALLRSVKQEVTQKSDWTGTSGTGGYGATMSAAYAASESGFVGALDAGSFTGSFSSNGDAGGVDVNKSAGQALVIDAWALDTAYKQAQGLWRNGRCVMVTAPEYGAETPISVGEQEKVQHDEEVDTSSETKFAVRLRHRFGGGVEQPASASLSSGGTKLAPSRLDNGSGQLTYTAPDEEDKQATVLLKTTSKRGIGTLVLEFHTAGGELTLTASGTLRFSPQAVPITYIGKVTMGPAVFKKKDATTYRAESPSTINMRLEGLPFPCEVTFSGGGTVVLTATIEKRGDQSVWIVRPDPSAGSESMSASSCAGGVPATSFGTGGYGIKFWQVAGDVVIPRGGGTVQLHATRALDSISGVTYTVDGSATGTVNRK